MTAREAIELIKIEVEASRKASVSASKQKAHELKRKYYQWQACLEVATAIYHIDDKDALERIMALKLHTKLS